MRRYSRALGWAAIMSTVTLYYSLSKDIEIYVGKDLKHHQEVIDSNVKSIPPLEILGKEGIHQFLRKSKSFDKSSVLNLFPGNPILRTNHTKLKRIFLYTKYFQKDKHFNLGLGREQFLSCKFKNCFTTNDKNLLGVLDEFDAVLFHPAENFSKPLLRSPDQLYIMQRYETPISNEFPYEEFTNFFNWTLSDRFDADVFIPRLTFVPKGERYELFNKNPSWDKWRGQVADEDLEEIKKEFRKLAEEKSDLYISPRKNAIGWIVSHCNTCSDRETYANELNKHYPVVARGFCKGFTCSDESLTTSLFRSNITSKKSYENDKTGQNLRFKVNSATMHQFHVRKRNKDDGCEMFVRRYKYYLAFENSVCLDYISEKTFKPYLAKTIPILMGGGQFDRVLPPHSYINAMDFDSPKALVEYLKYLDQNEDRYMEYFWWWKYYDCYTSVYYPTSAACVLCQMLNQAEIRRQSYSDIGAWYLSSCEQKGSFPWSRPEMMKFGCKKKDSLTFKDMGLTL